MDKIAISDWLYRNNYGWIYEEWLTSPERTFEGMSVGDYLKKKHPDVWAEYNK